MSVETGIAPQHLLESPPGMLEAMVEILRRRAEESRKKGRS